MAKIGLVSFEDKGVEVNGVKYLCVDNKKRWRLFNEIRDYAKRQHITHLLFSGSTLCDGKKRDSRTVSGCVRRIGQIFKEFHVVFEVNKNGNKASPYGLYAYQKGKKVAGPIVQMLWSSDADADLYNKLWNEIESGCRIITLGGCNIMFLICGELNILHNQQSNKNKVDDLRKPLQGRKIRILDYDVLFNPTHTPLTCLYGKYKCRLEYMSKGKENRLALLNFNVPDNQNRRTAAFMAYRNGKEVKRKKELQEDWSNGWAMRIIDV